MGTGISGLIASIICAFLTGPNLLNLSPKIASEIIMIVSYGTKFDSVTVIKISYPLIIGHFYKHIINQGLTPIIVFDCSNGLHLSKASQYRWYQSIYYSGVSFSRLILKKINCQILGF
uniref:Battenin n=1 Tax=Strongyloides venezuelensis TaxID=75913 RepID=A0A0K0FCN6_STRVS